MVGNPKGIRTGAYSTRAKLPKHRLSVQVDFRQCVTRELLPERHFVGLTINKTLTQCSKLDTWPR